MSRMRVVVAAILCVAWAARAEWIDRVQPACAELRAYAAGPMGELKTLEELARYEKDPKERKLLKDKAAKLRGPAQAQQRKYEKCKKTAPKVMSEEQARREENEAAMEQLKQEEEKRRHPPGAIAPAQLKH